MYIYSNLSYSGQGEEVLPPPLPDSSHAMFNRELSPDTWSLQGNAPWSGRIRHGVVMINYTLVLCGGYGKCIYCNL